ncbi:MAG: hypothetical protein JO035_02235, partial [Betaproteobacteria bacterium]|nr:hypothetical protein [Betaproteobacteria bacterium]
AGPPLQQAHHPRHLAPLHHRYAADLEAICRRSGVEFVDCNLDPRFESDRWLFIDRTHMNDEGHAILASLVAEWAETASSKLA